MPLNGFYIYKLQESCQREVNVRYHGKTQPKLILGKIKEVSYVDKQIGGDEEDWLDVNMELMHTDLCWNTK